jgi:hypothetical protein
MLSSGVAPGACRDERRGAERERHVFEAAVHARRKTYHVEPVSTGRLIAGMVFPPSVASRIFASWNQLDRWLRQIEGLRRAA